MARAASDVPAAAAAAAAAPPPPAGWRIIARKEFVDHVLSRRFTWLMLVMAVALIAAVYAAAGGIRDAAEGASGTPALFLKLFTAAPERIPPFFLLVGWLAPLLGVAFGFDAINGERSQGTLPRLVSQPIYRDDVINGKFLAGLGVIALGLTTLTLLMSGVGLVRIGVVPTLAEAARLALFLAVTIVYAGFWLALASLFSVLLRRVAGSASAAIAAWIVSTVFAGLLVGVVADVLAPVPENPTIGEVLRNAKYEQTMSRIFPNTLYQEVTIVLLNPEQRTLEALGSLLLQAEPRAVQGELSLGQSLLLAWPQVTLLVAATVICFAVAYVSFMRQEVRA